MAIPAQKQPPGFPPCVSLTIEFQPHAVNYETAAEWVVWAERARYCEWVSDAEREQAIATDSIWLCQWYPETPVGFCALAASSLEALMVAVNKGKVG